MQLSLLALNPTDSVTEGFLPAARRLGLDVTVLTDQPDAHLAACPGTRVLPCEVRDFRAVISRLSTGPAPDAVFTNSDHLQVQAALTADWFGLPGKDWRAALRTKDKAQMRRALAAAGLDSVRAAELPPGRDASGLLAAEPDWPFPCVVKPREGVASEDVALAGDAGELAALCAGIRDRRPGEALVVEEYLPGELCTLETLGDGRRRHVLGGFRTRLSPPPHFIEESLTWVPAHPEPVVAQVLAQLDALGAGFGACHTEFTVHEGRARLVEVNYRAIGDRCDLLLAELLGIPLFELILAPHLGRPLPGNLGLRTGLAARMDYPVAERDGTLTAAPGPLEQNVGQVRLTYRPLRAPGSHHEVRRTNRDFLGVVRAIGDDQRAVDRAVEDFLAAQHWEITP